MPSTRIENFSLPSCLLLFAYDYRSFARLLSFWIKIHRRCSHNCSAIIMIIRVECRANVQSSLQRSLSASSRCKTLLNIMKIHTLPLEYKYVNFVFEIEREREYFDVLTNKMCSFPPLAPRLISSAAEFKCDSYGRITVHGRQRRQGGLMRHVRKLCEFQ